MKSKSDKLKFPVRAVLLGGLLSGLLLWLRAATVPTVQISDWSLGSWVFMLSPVWWPLVMYVLLKLTNSPRWTNG